MTYARQVSSGLLRGNQPSAVRGSVLVLSYLMITIMLALALPESMQSLLSVRLEQRFVDSRQAWSLAEAGVERGIRSLQQYATSTPPNESFLAPIAATSLGTGTYTVTFSLMPNTSFYHVIAVGTTTRGSTRTGHVIVKVPVVMKTRDFASFADTNVTVDNSRIASYNSNTNPSASFGVIMLGTNGDIASNGSLTVTNFGQARGDASVKTDPATNITTSVGGTISGAQGVLATTYELPPPDFSIYDNLPMVPDWQPIPAGVYQDGGGGAGLSVSGGVDFYTDGTGPVTLYVKGPLTLNGGAIDGIGQVGAGYYHRARNLTIVVTPTSPTDKILLTGGGFIFATIYAPQMEMVIDGSNNFAVGSFTVKKMTVINTTSSGLAYDDDLLNKPLRLETGQTPSATVEALYFK